MTFVLESWRTQISAMTELTAKKNDQHGASMTLRCKDVLPLHRVLLDSISASISGHTISILRVVKAHSNI